MIPDLNRINLKKKDKALGFMQSPTTDNQILLRQAQNGSMEAYESIYRLYVPRVYRLALRLCGFSKSAEELTQDTFVQAWRKIRDFAFLSSFYTWLYRIMINQYLQKQRNVARERNYFLSNPSAEQFAIRSDSGLGIHEKLDLDQAIDALPMGARTILVLHDIEGFQHDEIAAMLNISVSTSKTQLHRARAILKEALQS